MITYILFFELKQVTILNFDDYFTVVQVTTILELPDNEVARDYSGLDLLLNIPDIQQYSACQWQYGSNVANGILSESGSCINNTVNNIEVTCVIDEAGSASTTATILFQLLENVSYLVFCHIGINTLFAEDIVVSVRDKNIIRHLVMS